jgi:serine/threonine protein kinase/WD40 repeat protein
MSDQRLALLDVKERNELESLLMDFDFGWTPERLGECFEQLMATSQGPYRDVSLAELVKIDLHRSWKSGRSLLLEDYFQRFPPLGSAVNVSAELILAEYEARRLCGSNVDLASYESRFPQQFGRIVRLASGLAESSTAVAPSRGSENPSAQASIDTSRIEQVRDTSIGGKARKSSVDLPSEFGRYRILRELGSGAMGRVYLAHDSQLDRQVALKTPSFVSDQDEAIVTRFYREARSAAKLHHRNICPVYDVGEIEGRHFISMAFVKGRSMADLIKPDKLPPQKTSAILMHRLAMALAEAHRHNVIHRDLKPANIMIDTKKEPVVMDFGLARQTDVESRVTRSGMAVGTPAYMSPEQVRGEIDEVGAAADIYALGVILYELMTGQLPFRGPIAKVVYGIVHEAPATPSAIRSEIDPRLESICAKMMAKKPGDRYQSMDEVASALKDFVKGSAKPKQSAASPASRSDRSSSVNDAGQFTETGALNAFFAAQVAQDPTNTIVETSPKRTPELVVDPKRPFSSGRDRSRGGGFKWIATGMGGVLFLASVIIYFSDGSKVEVEDGTVAVIETNPNGTLKSVTTKPAMTDLTVANVDADGITIRTQGDARQLAMSPGGQSFAVTGNDSPGRFTIYETETGRQIGQFDDPERPGNRTSQTAYSSDGKSLLYCTGNQVRVVSATSGAAEATYDFPAPVQLAVFPRRPWALALYHIRSGHRTELSKIPQRIKIWDWKSGDVLFDDLSPDQKINFPAISPDERFATFGSEHFHVRRSLRVDGANVTLHAPTQFENTSRVRGRMIFSPDGKLAACSMKTRHCVAAIVDVYTGRIVTKLDPASAKASNEGHQYGSSLGFSPDGTQIIVADHTGRVALWDVNTGELLKELDQFDKIDNHFPPGVVVGSNGHVVLGGTSSDRRISVKRLSKVDQADPGFVSLFPDGDLNGWSGIPGRWNIVSGELVGSESSGQSSLQTNTALCSNRSYRDFELRVDVKIEGDEKQPANSGIQFRSTLNNSSTYEMAGPQADIGEGYWGSVYGEKTSGLMRAADPDLIDKAVRADDWNSYRLMVMGDNVVISINGLKVLDEDVLGLPESGLIGFQIHRNRNMTVRFRNARIKEFKGRSTEFK